jgi:hypothetical protein
MEMTSPREEEVVEEEEEEEGGEAVCTFPAVTTEDRLRYRKKKSMSPSMSVT